MRSFYQPTPDGIIGNEDCGQMSAWYVMSAMGFYPICPGSDEYHIGRPLVDKASINVEGGVFTIKVKNNSPQNKRVKSVRLNGKGLKGLTFRHKEIKAGAILEIEMH